MVPYLYLLGGRSLATAGAKNEKGLKDNINK
jgi:hypothetical protein